jgi:hypothetical protein
MQEYHKPFESEMTSEDWNEHGTLDSWYLNSKYEITYNTDIKAGIIVSLDEKIKLPCMFRKNDRCLLSSNQRSKFCKIHMPRDNPNSICYLPKAFVFNNGIKEDFIETSVELKNVFNLFGALILDEPMIWDKTHTIGFGKLRFRELQEISAAMDKVLANRGSEL